MALNLATSGRMADPLGVSALILLLHIVIGFGLAFVPPTSRSHRAALMTISVSIAVNLLVSTTQFSNNSYLNGFLVTTVWCNILRAIDLLLLKRVYISPEINASSVMDFYRPRYGAKSRVSRLFSATLLLCSPRYVGTPWVCKRIPPFSTKYPVYTPSRRYFLLKNLATFVLTYGFIDLPNLLPPPDVEEIFPVAKEALFARLSEVTPDELVTRTLLVFSQSLATYCYLAVTSSFLAVVTVGLGMLPVEAWPPFFGPMKESYTIRRFWGESWHQLMRNFLEPLSDFLSTTLLRIPKGTLISRYTRLTFAFGISGFFHTIMDIVLGIHPLDSGTLRFFLMHAGGIMVQDAFQELYRVCGGKPNGCTLAVGYIWTSMFFVWTTPSWSWASIRVLVPRGDSSLPFSFAKYFVGKVW